MEPFVTGLGVIYPNQCDAMGHLNVKEYVGIFDQAEWHCFLKLDFDPRLIEKSKIGWADVRHLIDYKCELGPSDLFLVVSIVVKVGTTSIATRHELLRAPDNAVCAKLEAVTVQYDLAQRRAMPLVDAVKKAAAAAIAAEQNFGTDRQLGSASRS
jgi:acyl-CoA thioester hydrolase